MKHIKRFNESNQRDEIFEMVQLYLVNLLDNDFKFKLVSGAKSPKTTITIYRDSNGTHHYNNTYPYSEIKEDIIQLVKMLSDDYDIKLMKVYDSFDIAKGLDDNNVYYANHIMDDAVSDGDIIYLLLTIKSK